MSTFDVDVSNTLVSATITATEVSGYVGGIVAFLYGFRLPSLTGGSGDGPVGGENIHNPDADVALMGLVFNRSADNYASSDTKVPQYNLCIEALAEYFGFMYINQSNVITKENCTLYTHTGDTDSMGERYLHPNKEGHRVMFEELIRTLYADLKNK